VKLKVEVVHEIVGHSVGKLEDERKYDENLHTDPRWKGQGNQKQESAWHGRKEVVT